ncbi:MAG: metal ABC transporter substrate-binding protein [Erysipelotrichaceae bacterium]|nr:metal ABC transporter substrate-binding protein [Erysipelotrichaceae bacterium]
MKSFKKLLAVTLAAAALAGCSAFTNKEAAKTDSAASSNVINVGATTAPHAEILQECVKPMADKGYELKITEFSDYPNINPSTTDGSLDANYFQHLPYLESYNADNKLKSGDEGYLVSAGAIHYEPLGLYSKSFKSVDEVKDGAKIAVPNDATNEARALMLLQDLGLIKLNRDATISTATTADITENPKKLEIVELAADQIAGKLPDVDFAVINGNYALAGNVTDCLITTESKDSEAAKTYSNIIAVKESKKDDAAVKALVETLQSDEIKAFINKKYGVSVIPSN